MSLSVVLTSLIIYKIFFLFLSKYYSSNFILIIAIFSMFVSAVYLPYFNKNIYLGQGTPNPWHNPTAILIKPFALIAFILFMELFENKKHQNSIIFKLFLSFVLILSVLIKPNFLFVFTPALFIYLLFKTRNLSLYCKTFLVFLPSLIILIIQITRFYLFPVDNIYFSSKIAVDILDVWSFYSPNIPMSFLLANAFPLSLFLLIKIKDVFKSNYLFLSWIMLCVSVIQFAIFAEDGQERYAANFMWGYLISLFILFIFSIIEFLKICKLVKYKHKKIIQIPSFILLLHFFSGLYYFIRILLGGSYR